MSGLRLRPGEKEFLDTVRSLKGIGYGRMMQIIATEWYRVGGTGAFTLGPCVGNLQSEGAREAEYWLKNDPVFQATAKEGR